MAEPPHNLETLPAASTGEAPWSGVETSVPSGLSGRYVVRREVARGGLGRVVEAQDLQLQRVVALKELLRDTPANRARFRREILLTARLQHPTIVSLYEAIEAPDGQLRYAMKLVSGVTLDAAISAAGSLEGRLALLRHVVAVADAVAYAHAHGVIHRDIKPQNVLVGAFGETVLIDWGLAKELGEADAPEVADDPAGGAGLTRAGAVVGTPAYMSPEQARGEPADPRADVYALGATLYHLLANTPPFTGSADDSVASLREGATPPPLTSLVSGVPADLLFIVARATAPRREDRYASAVELSEDLHRFSTGQLVAARTYSPSDLVRRWVRTHRVVVAVAGLALVVLGVVGATSAWRVVAERDAAEQARAVAVARTNALVLAHAQQGAEEDPTEAAAWLGTYPLDGGDWEAAFLLTQEIEARGVARVAVRTSGDGCDSVVFDAGGAVLYPGGLGVTPLRASDGATAGAEARVDRVVALPGGGAVSVDAGGRVSRVGRDGAATLLGAISDVPVVATSLVADARTALVGDRAGRVTAFDLDGGGHRVLVDDLVRVNALSLSPTGWVAAGADGRVVRGAAAGGLPQLVRTSPVAVEALATATDGAVYLGDADGVVLLVDADGHATPVLRLPAPVVTVAVSADGRWLAAADGVTGLVVRDGETGRAYTPPWPAVRASALMFAPNAPTLAVTSLDGVLRLWRPDTGEVVERRMRGGVHDAAAFSPDGDQLAICGIDGSLRVWEAPAMAGSAFRGHEQRVFHVLVLGDGRVVSDSDDRTVRVWAPGSADALVLRGHTDRPYGLDATPSGDLVVSAGVDGQAIIWSTEHGSATPLRGHNGRVHRAMFLPDGASVLTAGSDGVLRTWGLDGRPIAEVQAHDGTAGWAVASGDSVWSAGSDRALRRWRPEMPGSISAVAEGLGERGGVTLRPHLLDDDEVLVCSGAPRELLVVGEQTRRIVLPVEPECASLGVSPDGRTVAVPSGPTVGLVDAVDGSYRALTSLNADVHAIAWSPDGAYVAAAVLDGTARLVRVADGASAIVAQGRGPTLGVAFSPDGATLAAAGVDAVVRVVPVDPSALVPPDPALLHARIAGLTAMIAPE